MLLETYLKSLLSLKLSLISLDCAPKGPQFHLVLCDQHCHIFLTRAETFEVRNFIIYICVRNTLYVAWNMTFDKYLFWMAQ